MTPKTGRLGEGVRMLLNLMVGGLLAVPFYPSCKLSSAA